jgi:hypothetical protein
MYFHFGEIASSFHPLRQRLRGELLAMTVQELFTRPSRMEYWNVGETREPQTMKINFSDAFRRVGGPADRLCVSRAGIYLLTYWE